MTSVVALRLTTPRVVKLSLKRPATAHRPTVRPTLALPNPAPYPHSMEVSVVAPEKALRKENVGLGCVRA